MDPAHYLTSSYYEHWLTGGSTLLVTPAGESVLIDSGNPGTRDAGRIFKVASEVAGLKRIDHCVTTHFHIDHFVAGKDALVAGVLHTAFHGRNINPVYILAGERLGKVDPGISLGRGDTHPDLGKLAGATRLFFMAMLRIRRELDGFTVRDLWLRQSDVHIETACKTIHQHLEVQFALGGDDGLVEFRVHTENEGGILFVQGSQPGGYFVFLAFGSRLEGGVDGGFGVVDTRQNHWAFG
jgi:hypothetical protein